MTRREWLRLSLASGAAWSVGSWRSAAFAQAGLTVETASGRVRGATLDGVHIFKGIPYGGPASGAGRFKPPAPAVAWPGVRDATATGPRAIQVSGNLFLEPVIGAYFSGGRPDMATFAREEESEDCLNLNVLTPGVTGRRPVMVYIHGGGFGIGSNFLTALSDRFVREQDVVLVGVNHRLNMFGYLYLGAFSEAFADSGNAGQLDLIAALRWVRENISRFGGDPGNVTIFGESGGGAKISALLAMPSAAGLFHRAIVESGSRLKAVPLDDAARAAAAALRRIGVTEAQVDQLEHLPLERLRTAGGGIGAIVDGRSIPSQTWDPVAPAVSAHVPMIGTCKDETTLFSRLGPGTFALDDSGLRRRVIAGGIPEASADQLLGLYRRDYPGDSPSDLFFRLAADRAARAEAITQAERQLAQGQPQVYMYYFSWNTPVADGAMRLKAFHTAELPLAMRLTRYPESEPLSKQIASAWAGFARSGNPTPEGMTAWPRYDLTRRATMVFDLPSRVVDDPNRDQRLLLQTLPSGPA